MFSVKLDSKRYNLRSSKTGHLDVPKKHNRSFLLALNCGITWTAEQDKQFLFLFFRQKYYIFYLVLTVINLLNRSMYGIFNYIPTMCMFICIYTMYNIDFLHIAHIIVY